MKQEGMDERGKLKWGKLTKLILVHLTFGELMSCL